MKLNFGKGNPESWGKGLKAWFYMNCLRRMVTIIMFPWEHSCLVWTKFTSSRICNSSLHPANHRPISLHKQRTFSHLMKFTVGHGCETSTHKDLSRKITSIDESPLINSCPRQMWLNQNASMFSFPWSTCNNRITEVFGQLLGHDYSRGFGKEILSD